MFTDAGLVQICSVVVLPVILLKKIFGSSALTKFVPLLISFVKVF